MSEIKGLFWIQVTGISYLRFNSIVAIQRI